MKLATTLPLILGVTLMGVTGVRLAKHVGLLGWDTGLVILFAAGIILVSREPARQLAERVRALEQKLEESGRTP